MSGHVKSAVARWRQAKNLGSIFRKFAPSYVDLGKPQSRLEILDHLKSGEGLGLHSVVDNLIDIRQRSIANMALRDISPGHLIPGEVQRRHVGLLRRYKRPELSLPSLSRPTDISANIWDKLGPVMDKAKETRSLLHTARRKLVFRGDTRSDPYAGGYGEEWVHGTPFVSVAREYGSLPTSKGAVSLVNAYKASPKQQYFPDWSLEKMLPKISGAPAGFKPFQMTGGQGGIRMYNTPPVTDIIPPLDKAYVRKTPPRDFNSLARIEALRPSVRESRSVGVRKHPGTLVRQYSAYETPITRSQNPFLGKFLLAQDPRVHPVSLPAVGGGPRVLSGGPRVLRFEDVPRSVKHMINQATIHITPAVARQ